MRIVYFGTPEFAAFSLEKIIQTGYSVVAVVTSPDKPAGRGLKPRESAVKQVAARYGLPVLQPTNMKSPEFIAQLRNLQPDLGIVIAFRMMPEAVWSLPPLGTFNLHGSLLPAYRGAAPINRVIMNGEKVSGVSTFFLQHEIDTGDLLMQAETPIGEDETAGELHDRLMHLGADLVLATLHGIVHGTLTPTPQVTTGEEPTAPKIFPADCAINWNKGVAEVHNQIRGLSPFPGAFSTHLNKNIKVLRSKPRPEVQLPVGHWEKLPGNQLVVGCRDGGLELLEVQPEGRKRMSASDYLNGIRSS
jgi:methionyl-tRNA formyltransferase